MSCVKNQVSEYYGNTLQNSDDLKTNACCTLQVKIPKHVREAIDNVADEVQMKYYGCGIVVPPGNLKGLRVLDLGCGAGRDVYTLAQIVGESGYVIGVDMTKEQIDVAREYQTFHSKKFGFNNTEFIHGIIEDLSMIPDQSIDLVVSNCVVNLSDQKQKIIQEVSRVLKHGGEFYFSDVYSNRRIPKSLQEDNVLWGECLSGALYTRDFHLLCKQQHFFDIRTVTSKPITIDNKSIENKLDGFVFTSVTFRMFKIDKLDEYCEDYGHQVMYKGGLIQGDEDNWALDSNHAFKKNEKKNVCKNTFLMLHETRFKDYFHFYDENCDVHLGPYSSCC